MSSLANISANKDMATVAKVATSYLNTEWKQVTREKGSEFIRVQMEKLLQIYISNSSSIFHDLRKLCLDGTHGTYFRGKLDFGQNWQTLKFCIDFVNFEIVSRLLARLKNIF